MNLDWAIGKIDGYIGHLRGYESRPSDHPYFENLIWEALPVAQKIAEQVRPDLRDAITPMRLASEGDNQLAIAHALDAARYVKGALASQVEVEENLAKPGPKLQAESLHPWIWQAAKTPWETENFRHAVQQAATSLNHHVQARVGRRDVSDSDLMRQVFSNEPPEPGRPRLRWPGDNDDLEVRSMRDGLRLLAPGMVMTIRNPAHHGTEEYTEQEALERLAALSLLARFIEECEPQTVED